MPTALVTGGTSGLGAAFARALAREGHDLVLVARDGGRLASAAAQLETAFGVGVETISADLADRADALRVAARLEDPARPIGILVNNAGFGMRARLTSPESAEHERAIDVMIRAVLLLGGAAARAMRDRGDGVIVNVSSVAGYIRMGAYSAVKAWVTAYSEGLAVELRGTGVTVVALTPGWVRTEFHERAGIDATSIPASLWTDVDTVVATALRDARRGRAISTPTARFRVLVWFCRHLPRATIRWVSGRISGSRHRAETPPEPAPPLPEPVEGRR